LPAAFFVFAGTASAVGRFGWAAASDFLGRRNTYLAFAACVPVMAGAPYLAHFSADAAATAVGAPPVWPLATFAAGSMLAITCYGGVFSVLPAYIADLWGQRHSGAIHGKALTAWSAASVSGPVGLATLRAHSEREAIEGLCAEVAPAAFEGAFGAPLSQLEALVEAKTVTIARLLEVLPPGTVDPTPFLYDTTCFAAASLMGCAALTHGFLRPTDLRGLIEKEASHVALQAEEAEHKK